MNQATRFGCLGAFPDSVAVSDAVGDAACVPGTLAVCLAACYTISKSTLIARGLCVWGILLAVGCSGSKGVVSGKVLYQGKPIRGGTVSFILEKGGVMFCPIEEDGSYTIRNVPPGPVKITVETQSFRPLVVPAGPRSGPPELMKKMMEPQTNDPERAKRYVPIPIHYSDPSKSNLTYTVQSGAQIHDIDLK
jgi:hypothetical protein